MQYDEFIGHVQHRAHVGTRGEAEMATRALLQTLGERLAGGAAENLAAQLPPELHEYLKAQQDVDGFSVEEFLERVSERERVDLPKSIHHSRAVIDVLTDAVTEGQMQKIRAQLPDDYDPLFESGSEGDMDLRM